jgi:pimeloyl-ACP methyl ester carboxylesterase
MRHDALLTVACLLLPLASAAAQQAPPSTALPPEETHLIAFGSSDTPARLFLRHQRPASQPAGRPRSPVLFIHGASFPSGLAAAFRFDGVSWMTDLASRGFDVWALDFIGYGGSDRHPGMRDSAHAHPPLGRVPDAVPQVEVAIAFINRHSRGSRVSLVAHSWGTMVAGRYAEEHPGHVDRLVLFGPHGQRAGAPSTTPRPAHTRVTVDEQHRRFTGYVPAGSPPVLDARHFLAWGEAYLASDVMSGSRTPPSVLVPGGPGADIGDAWSGRLPYDPARITAPVLIVRGEWDTVTRDADARWLLEALKASPLKQDVTIPRGTHVMHLEASRAQLYAQTAAFLDPPAS